MIEKICLCSSRIFFERLWKVKDELENLGCKVFLPSMKNIQDTLDLEEMEFANIHQKLIKKHFKKIDESDAILVCNYDKNGIEGYVGGNVVMEIAKSSDSNKQIFLLNPVPQMPYRAEILATHPIVLIELKKITKHV